MFANCFWLGMVGFVLWVVPLGFFLEGKSMTEIQSQVVQLRVTLISCDWQQETSELSMSARIIQFKEFGIKDSERLVERLRAVFPIQNLESFGYGELTPGNLPNEVWMKDGIMTQVFIRPEEAQYSDMVEVRITFDDIRTGDSYVEQLPLTGGEGAIVLFQRGNSQKVLALLLSLIPEASKAERYHLEYKTDRFTIFSRDRSWVESNDQQEQVIFHQAKVVIPVQGEGDFILEAEEIIYSKGASELIGCKAVLFDSSNDRVVEGEKIKLTFADGSIRYEIVGG